MRLALIVATATAFAPVRQPRRTAAGGPGRRTHAAGARAGAAGKPANPFELVRRRRRGSLPAPTRAPPPPARAPPPPKKQVGGSMFNMDPFGTAGGGSYVPAGMSKAEYDRIQAEGAAKKAANRNKKRGSNMSLEEAQRTGYKTFVSLKGDATQKQAKKGWLNPFSDE